MKRSRATPRWFQYSGGQQKALQFADATEQLVFVCDERFSKNNAKKYGVVESHSAMYEYIQTCVEKTFYELIRDDRSARLYLDFDAYFSSSSRESAFDKAISDTIALIFIALRRVGVVTDRVVVLESSGSSESKQGLYKCSRHVHFPHAWFRCNFSDMSVFLQKYVQEDAMLVFKAAGFSAAWDTSVYSRNRPFRMMGCHKRGSKRVLRTHSGEASREAFFNALVQPPNAPKDPICIGPASKKTKLVPPRLASPIGKIFEWFRSQSPPKGDPDVYSCSPFATRSLVSGLCYRMNSRSKFCRKLQRKHRHNNIYYVVDLRRGHVRQCCYSGATCKTEQCRGDSHRTINIPTELLPQRKPMSASMGNALFVLYQRPRALHLFLRKISFAKHAKRRAFDSLLMQCMS